MWISVCVSGQQHGNLKAALLRGENAWTTPDSNRVAFGKAIAYKTRYKKRLWTTSITALTPPSNHGSGLHLHPDFNPSSTSDPKLNISPSPIHHPFPITRSPPPENPPSPPPCLVLALDTEKVLVEVETIPGGHEEPADITIPETSPEGTTMGVLTFSPPLGPPVLNQIRSKNLLKTPNPYCRNL